MERIDSFMQESEEGLGLTLNSSKFGKKETQNAEKDPSDLIQQILQRNGHKQNENRNKPLSKVVQR
jgi:hypothetical protein